MMEHVFPLKVGVFSIRAMTDFSFSYGIVIIISVKYFLQISTLLVLNSCSHCSFSYSCMLEDIC